MECRLYISTESAPSLAWGSFVFLNLFRKIEGVYLKKALAGLGWANGTHSEKVPEDPGGFVPFLDRRQNLRLCWPRLLRAQHLQP